MSGIISADDFSVWHHRRIKTVGSDSERPGHCVGNIYYLLQMAGRSTAKGNIWFLDEYP